MQDEWEQQHSLCEHRRYDSGAGREYFENCADDRQKIDIRSGQALEVESNNTVFRLSSFASIWDLFLHTSQADVYSEENFMAFSGFECNFQLSSCQCKRFKSLKDFWRHLIDHMRPLVCEDALKDTERKGCLCEFYSVKDAERHYCMVRRSQDDDEGTGPIEPHPCAMQWAEY